MDSSRISDFMSNNYIPRATPKKSCGIPLKHPSLIMQDNTTDASHRLKCGCAGDSCVFERFAETENGENLLHKVYEEQYHIHGHHSANSVIVSGSPPRSASAVSARLH